MNLPDPNRDYVAQNLESWTNNAGFFAESADREWSGDPTWGCFLVPESEVGMIPADISGLDVIELGCGTAYVSAWLAQRGAKPVGIDLTPAQLETARQMQDKYDIHFPLFEGNAEATPFDDASADFVISEYGASIWCDPYKWIPEAWRLLRPGGRLHFLRSTPLTMACTTDDEDGSVVRELQRPMFGLFRLDWGKDGIEFNLPHGKMIELLVETGFVIDGLVEIQVPADATTRYPYITAEWASQWPFEEVWKVHKPL